MNYSSYLWNQTRRPLKTIDSTYDPFNMDSQSLDFSFNNKSLDRHTQFGSKYLTEQKPRTSLSNQSSDTTEFEEETSYKRIQLTLDKYKFYNTDEKASAKRFNDINEKINSHLNKISQFLSNNKPSAQVNKNFEKKQEQNQEPKQQPKQEQKQQPKQEPKQQLKLEQSKQESSYLQLRQKKQLSVNPQQHYCNKRHHFTNFAHYLFSNGMTNPSTLKQYLRQLKIDLSDRERAIRYSVSKTQYWQNVWLGPREVGKQKTLVLDLDETLIHSSFDQRNKQKFYELKIPCTFDFRPFLKEFMEKCNKVFEIVIFTASEENYANLLVNRIKQLCNNQINIKKILDRKFLNSLGQKDLSIIKDRDLKDIIFIDNLALSFAKGQLDNGIPILEWTGDSRDKELKKIVKFLLHAERYEDVREVIKETFNLERFMSENIEWDALEAEYVGSPIFSQQCKF